MDREAETDVDTVPTEAMAGNAAQGLEWRKSSTVAERLLGLRERINSKLVSAYTKYG